MSYNKRLKEQQDIYEQRREWEKKYNPVNLRKEIDENREHIDAILDKLQKLTENCGEENE